MPKPRTSDVSGTNHAQGATGSNLYSKQYVRCTLSDADKERLKSQEFGAVKTYKIFQDFVDEGHKVSVQFETNNDCYGAYATQSSEVHGNFKFCLTARGPDVESALRALLYKHFEMLAGDWSSGQAVRNDTDGWG